MKMSLFVGSSRGSGRMRRRPIGGGFIVMSTPRRGSVGHWGHRGLRLTILGVTMCMMAQSVKVEWIRFWNYNLRYLTRQRQRSFVFSEPNLGRQTTHHWRDRKSVV